MRDEEYQPDQLPAYGTPAQPALVARAERELRTTLIGTVLGGVSAVAAILAFALYPSWDGPGPWWALASAVGALGVLVCCLVQHLAWRRAVAVWAGQKAGVDLFRLSRASWVVHVVAYVAVGLTIACGLISLADAGFARVTVLVFVGLVAAGAALVLAGVQYVRASGAPGTPPAHMHRVVERNRSRVTR